MKNWILKKKIPLLVTVIGAIAGFLYWNYVGCATGSCGITANWHTSTAYGSLMGWFVGDFASNKFNSKKNENDEK
jgi:hypothetical protein